jgi:hypothetical protein
MRGQPNILSVILSAFCLSGSLWADDVADDIARIHIEAIGGEARVARLESFRAAGQSQVGDFVMEFQMWAARPQSIRIEVNMQNKTLVQGWDGQGDPWIQNSQDGPTGVMPVGLAERFKVESSFDTPLFRPAERGFSLEYAGEVEVDGRPAVKLLATRDLTDQSMLYLSADTYFILRQDRTRREDDGSALRVQTFYNDFRPVLRVIMPHRIAVKEGERIVSDVVLNWMEPNPPIDESDFRMPGAPVPPPTEEPSAANELEASVPPVDFDIGSLREVEAPEPVSELSE